VFRRRRFLSGADGEQLRWYTPAGTIVTGPEWADPDARSVAIYLDGADQPDQAADGGLLVDDDLLVLVNGWWEPMEFLVPATRPGQVWTAEIDSSDPGAALDRGKVSAGEQVIAGPRSVLVLRGPVGSSELPRAAR
jgi:glycogen operon protein